jgi:hypothetical protein
MKSESSLSVAGQVGRVCPQPVAWMTANDFGNEPLVTSVPAVADAWRNDNRRVTPLYAVPGDWQVVPKEPTPGMTQAVWIANNERDITSTAELESAYSAMLYAASDLTPKEE